jgi:hypothetical protein
MRGVTTAHFSDHEQYWADLVRLLQIYQLAKVGRREKVQTIKRQMSSQVFNSYIQRRQQEQPLAMSDT